MPNQVGYGMEMQNTVRLHAASKRKKMENSLVALFVKKRYISKGKHCAIQKVKNIFVENHAKQFGETR